MESKQNIKQYNYQKEPLIRKKIDFYNDKEILKIQQSCIEMGFDLNMVNKIIFYFNIRRENEIIDYLIKDENGFWNHPFIPILSQDDNQNNNIIQSNSLLANNKIVNNVISRVNSINSIKENIIPKKDELCEVCGEHKNFHRIKNFNLNLNNNILIRENSLNKDTKDNDLNGDIILDVEEDNKIDNIINNDINTNSKDEIQDKNICPICLDNFENPLEIENCNHKLCQECFNEYLINLIDQNNIDNIPCPYKKCHNNSISEQFFSQYISEQTYFKYRQFKAQNDIARDPKKFFCPHCDSYALIEDDLEKYNNNNPNYIKSTLKCTNGHEFCSCGRPLHEGDCYKEDKAFKELIKKENIKQCPKCGFLIKKNKGCNHITCGNPLCKYEFCWLCMKESIPDHYKYGPCAGMQFIDPDSILFIIKKKYPKIFCLYNLFYCLYVFVILILFLFICPGLTFIYFSYHIIFHRYGQGITFSTKRYCMDILYFISISCVFISVQSIIYMLWFTILAIISCSIFSCILKCILNIVFSRIDRNRRENGVQIGYTNDNNL